MPAPREAPRKLQDETGTGTELLSLVTCPRASVSLGNVQGCISSPQGPARRGCSGSCSGCAAPCWICRISSTSWIGELVTGTVATHTPGRPKVGVGGHYPGNCVECYPSGTSQERGVHFSGLRKAPSCNCILECLCIQWQLPYGIEGCPCLSPGGTGDSRATPIPLYLPFPQPSRHGCAPGRLQPPHPSCSPPWLMCCWSRWEAPPEW